MDYQVFPQQEQIPPFDRQALAIQHIAYDSGKSYEKDQITPQLVQQLLAQFSQGISVYLSVDPNGEEDWLEVVSDGEWLCLIHCLDEGEDCYTCYNPAFSDTVEQIEACDFCDEAVWSPIESGGQTPIPKLQAIQDMDAGTKAVEYFLYTGQRYPGIDWLHW